MIETIFSQPTDNLRVEVEREDEGKLLNLSNSAFIPSNRALRCQRHDEPRSAFRC
jgi:hypothetical protein